MSELDRLVQKHRANGLLIDTNLFLLWLIGSTNIDRIARFPRTQKYSPQEYRLLASVVERFSTVVTTPHVLTEVSNLANLSPPELGTLRTRLSSIVEKSKEVFEPSLRLMTGDEFASLGLTDAAILQAAQEPMLVLTDDLPLYLRLQSNGRDAINLNHLRPI